MHLDNVGLRKLISLQRPLVYLHGIVPGQYLAVWPVFVVGDDASSLTFRIAVDDIAAVATESYRTFAESSARRNYLTAAVRVRFHQRSFRERVLSAYRSQCSLCHLRHRELLDAAHIVPDTAPEGEPRISNGIALCKLHHAAYDAFIIGVSPDYRVLVRNDVLVEEDGPMFQHGLQALHGARLLLPSSREQWPDRDALDWRFQRFLQAA